MLLLDRHDIYTLFSTITKIILTMILNYLIFWGTVSHVILPICCNEFAGDTISHISNVVKIECWIIRSYVLGMSESVSATEISFSMSPWSRSSFLKEHHKKKYVGLFFYIYYKLSCFCLCVDIYVWDYHFPFGRILHVVLTIRVLRSFINWSILLRILCLTILVISLL